MDKNTLSNYGWIVIAVLVLSVMIALATPFGAFIENGVRSTTEGLFDTSKNAMNSAFGDLGVEIKDQEFDSINTNSNPTQTKRVGAIFTDGTFLTWDELQLEENGTKYGYKHNKIYDDEVGYLSFEDCTTLESIVIPAKVKSIAERAFTNCTSLISVEFEDGTQLGSIGNYALLGTSITTFTVPKTVYLTNWQAFCAIDTLTELIFESGRERPIKIGGALVQNSTNVKRIVYPKEIEYFGKNIYTGIGAGTITIEYQGTKQEWQNIPKGEYCNEEAIKEIICSNGIVCSITHTGGTETCEKGKVCTECGVEYTIKNAHTPVNGVCSICNQTVTVIETKHNPYLNNQDNVTVGTWDYSDAKSVTITMIYQVESLSGFPIDYISLVSNNKYINENGELVDSSVKFFNNYITTTTFTTSAVTGSVIFKSGSSGNEYYGLLVEVTPNY